MLDVFLAPPVFVVVFDPLAVVAVDPLKPTPFLFFEALPNDAPNFPEFGVLSFPLVPRDQY